MTLNGARRWRAAILVGVAAVALALAGCNDSSTSPQSPPTPTTQGGDSGGY
jgi:hypothetical protein